MMPNTSVVLKHGRYQLTFRVWAIKLICHLSSNRTPIARLFEQHLNCLPKETGSLKISIKFRRFQVRSLAGTNFFFSFLPCPSRRVWRVPRLQGRGSDQDCLPIQKMKVQRYKGTEIPVPRAAGLVLKSGTLKRSKGGFIGYSVAQHVPELLTPQTHPKHCTFGGEFSYL